MEYSVKAAEPAKLRSQCLVLGVYESCQLSTAAEAFDQAHSGYLSKLLKQSGMNGNIGQSLLLFHIPQARCERVLLIGCGKRDKLDARALRKVIAAANKALGESGAREAVSFLAELDTQGQHTQMRVRQHIECMEAENYRFTELKRKSGKNDRQKLKKLVLAVSSQKALSKARKGLAEGVAVAKGVGLAKTLGNLPGNICTPNYLAQQARRLGRNYAHVKTHVIDQAGMEKLGMGCLLAVARASAQPAKLITMEYRNGPKGQAPIVFVGKGITFDTGGISLKPGAAMDEMKFDMCGAASVFGALQTCAELELPLNVVGVVAAAENMPGGKAIKPGDVVTSMSGQTVEILNTDAEGRLILCDALTYCERYKPAAVIDIATLTGACVIALGKHPHGLFGNQQTLADQLINAGERAVDRCWQMPVWEEYQDQLKSNFADMANIGGREGGAVTAACFLSRFAHDFDWAHLDIAGTAWLSGKSKGATGRPVPLLVQFLLDQLD